MLAISIELKKSYILSKIIIFWYILAFENDSLYAGLKTVNTRSTRSALASLGLPDMALQFSCGVKHQLALFKTKMALCSAYIFIE